MNMSEVLSQLKDVQKKKIESIKPYKMLSIKKAKDNYGNNNGQPGGIRASSRLANNDCTVAGYQSVDNRSPNLETSHAAQNFDLQMHKDFI